MEVGNGVGLETQRVSLVNSLLKKYWQYWPLLFGLILATTVTALVYLRYAVPTYGISALIMLKESDKGLSNLPTSAAAQEGAYEKKIDDEIAVVDALPFCKTVSQDLHLYAPIYIKGKFIDRSAFEVCPVWIEAENSDFKEEASDLPFTLTKTHEILFMNKSYLFGQWIGTVWGNIRFVNNPFCTDKNAVRKYYFSLTSNKKIAQGLQKSFDIAPLKKETTTLISLKIKDEVPAKGKAILNDLIKVYNQSTIDEKTKEAAATLKFVQARLALMQGQINHVEGGIQKYKTDQGIVDINQQGEQYLSSLTSNDQRLNELRTQLAVLDQIDGYLKSKNGESVFVPSTAGIDDPLLAPMLQKLSDLKLQYESLRKTTAENNPILSSLDNQMNQLKPSILEIIRNHRENLIANLKNLQANSQKYNAILSNIPGKERKLSAISRDQSTQNTLYSFLLQKREESEIAMATASADSRIVESPEATDYPVSPRKALVLLLAIAAALVLISGFIAIRELFQKKVQSLKQVEDSAQYPVILSLPKQKKLANPVDQIDRKDFLFHQFSVLVGILTRDKQGLTLLITALAGREGRFFVALRLASTMAFLRKKVILVEADMYKPRLAQHYQINSARGLTEFLKGQIPAREVIYKTQESSNFDVLPAGATPENPSEWLMQGEKMSELFDFLRETYEVVIVLAAPVVPCIDAYALDKYVDTTLLVIRENVTTKDNIQWMNYDSGLKNVKNVSIVYNASEDEKAAKKWVSYG